MNTQGALVKMEVKYWNVIFWIIVLFSTINQLIAQFSKENNQVYIYYYTLINPVCYILSKIIFHTIYSCFISLITFLIFCLWFGNPVENYSMILISIILGSSSFTILFTLTTAISKGLQNNAVLTSILGFPLAIPLITMVSKVSREAFFSTLSDNFMINCSILVAFNVLMLVLSVILYPYIWRE